MVNYITILVNFRDFFFLKNKIYCICILGKLILEKKMLINYLENQNDAPNT